MRTSSSTCRVRCATRGRSPQGGPRSYERGFTLIEMLLGFALLGLLSLMFVWFLVPAMRMASLGTARVDIQQMAVLACNRIAADLQRSAPSAVSLHSRAAADPAGPVVIAMVPIKDVNLDGQRVWETQVVAYFWDRNELKLLRRTCPPGPPTLSIDPLPTNRPSILPAVDLISLAAPSPTLIAVASKVVSFDVTQIIGGRAFALDISIEEGVSGKQKAERFDYKKVVSLRN